MSSWITRSTLGAVIGVRSPGTLVVGGYGHAQEVGVTFGSGVGVPGEGVCCTMADPAAGNEVRAALDRATDELIFIGPDHPYYALLSDLVSAVGKAWQQGYEQGRWGGHEPNPYIWGRPDE